MSKAKQYRPFNHHGSPKEILGANGQPVAAVQDEKTYIQEYEPIRAMVLVRVRHETGLIVPDGAESVGSPFCDVIATGPDCKQVRVGDRSVIINGAQYCRIPYRGDTTGMFWQLQEGNLAGICNPRPRNPILETDIEIDEASGQVKLTDADLEMHRREMMVARSKQAANDVTPQSNLGGT